LIDKIFHLFNKCTVELYFILNFQIFKELPKHLPAILFIPNIGEFWTSLSYPLQKLFSELMDSMDITLPVLTFATSLYDIKDLPNEVNN
jgi:hypothetical protein